MRKLLLCSLVALGAATVAPSWVGVSTASAAPAWTGEAVVQQVQYYGRDWRVREEVRHHRYEEWRRHEAWRHYEWERHHRF